MDVYQNPFAILSASTRDNRRRIMELAEEASLIGDEGRIRDAQSTLTNPRKRLSAELAWVPGVAPRRINELINQLRSAPNELLEVLLEPGSSIGDMTPLARSNLLSAAVENAAHLVPQEMLVLGITELAGAYDGIDLESIALLINEERSVAGFPALTEKMQYEVGIDDRRQHFRKSIKNALNSIPTKDLVSVVTIIVEKTTDFGNHHAPVLIDDMVDAFEVEAKTFLDAEAENVERLINEVRVLLKKGDDEKQLGLLVGELERVLKNWDWVAQPIQLSARGRGIDHVMSHEIASDVRGLAVDIYNEHGHLEISQRLNKLIQDVFAEVDRVVEQSNEDAEALDDIAVQRTQYLNEVVEKAEEWRKEITYSTEVGLVFKDTLSISPEGVSWKEKHMNLGDITRVRWGATRHYVNGVPSGTTFSIFVGSESNGIAIELNKEDVYSNFINRLWKAVGTRILTEFLEGLRKGQRFRFGNITVDDYGIELERGHLFSADERVKCRWNELAIGTANGGFSISKSNDKRFSESLSYQDVDNVHVLEAAMRVFWKRVSNRLSDLLQ